MQSIYDMRKAAPLHWQARAHNARLAVYALAHLSEQDTKAAAAAINYGRTAGIALREAFTREAAIALELILKAVLAAKKVAIPENHDLVTLWDKAGLPKLDNADRYRLTYWRTVLIWSGRYPTAKTEVRYYQDDKELSRLVRLISRGSTLNFSKHPATGWADFDRLYTLAAEEFSRQHKN